MKTLRRLYPLAMIASLAPPHLHAQVATSHVMAAPWGQLVASSETSFGVASSALRQSAQRFETLFGERPPAIGVVVDDTSAGNNTGNAVSPNGGPLVVITGAVRNDGHGRAELDTMVRYMAAATWVDSYTKLWRETVVELVPASGPAALPRAELPDWLRLGAVALVAEGAEKSDSVMRQHVGQAIPLRGLFGVVVGADGDASMVATQAASVLDYLRLTEGASATRDLFGLLATGADLESALHALPRPASIEALDAAWRRWLSAVPTDAILPRNGVR